MPGFASTDDSQSITPGRNLTLEGDFSETIIAEEPIGHSRTTWEIKAFPGSHDVMQLTSGAWSMKPLQDVTANITEVTDPTNSVIQGSDPILGMTTALGVNPVTINKPPTNLPGATTGGSPNLAIANNFYEKTIPPETNWDGQVIASDATGFPGPTLPSANIVMDRIAYSNGSLGENIGTLFRFKDYGNQLQSPDFIGTFYFGGPNFAASPVMGPVARQGGEYCIAITGDGVLRCFVRMPVNDGSVQWIEFAESRYAEPHRVAGYSHSIMILPHIGPGKRYLEIRSGITDNNAPMQLNNNPYIGPHVPGRFTLIDLLRVIADIASITIFKNALKAVLSMKNATGQGQVRVDGRRDNRFRWQASRLTYPPNGLLVDGPFPVPGGSSNLAPLKMRYITSQIPNPPGNLDPNMTPVLYDATTLAPLTPTAESGFGWANFTPNPGMTAYYAQFIFGSGNGDRTRSGLLWSYSVSRDGQIVTRRAPQWTTSVIQASTESGGKDPEAHIARAEIADKQNILKKLKRRGDVPMRFFTTYTTPNASTGTIELYRGYANRTDGKRMGVTTGLGWGAGSARNYPNPYWNMFDIQFIHYIKRLMTAQSQARVNLASDPNPQIVPTIDGGFTPYKVTDMIRQAINWSGFPFTAIDVPDAGLRFWPIPGDSEDSLFLEPYTPLGPVILQWLQDYLGWFLVWDGNAGTGPGMWRVKPPPLPDTNGNYTPLWTFVEDTSAGKMPLRQQSYPAATSPIIHGTLHERRVAAEGNFVTVYGIVSRQQGDARLLVQSARNTVSSDYVDPLTGVLQTTEDPNHPDSLGTVQPIVVIDPGLNTPEAIDWGTRREYDAACHTLQIFSFQAPLWFLTDTASQKTVVTQNTDGSNKYALSPAYRTLGDGSIQQRPLMIMDPVIVPVDGVPTTCFVTNVQLSNELKDRNQLMIVEAQAANPVLAV